MRTAVTLNKQCHFWHVAVATSVALLNQHQCKHAHSHSNPVKTGRVFPDGNANQGLMVKAKDYCDTHTQSSIYMLED